MRTAFIKELIDLARKDDTIFLVVGDLGFSVVEPFANEFPFRFLNAGVAEQNMTGIAAGLANEGYNVFTYSIGNFPTLRAMEQIRYDVCYNNMNVNIVSVGAGFAYGSLGVSHYATEDIGMMRTLPNMRVFSPGDPLEAQLVTEFVVKNPGPSYLRLGKAGETPVHKHDQDISIQKLIPVVIKPISNTAIITTGSILHYAFQFLKENKENACDLYSCPTIKPIDRYSLTELAERYNRLITLEEHQKSSGFGSAIIEVLSDLKFDKKIEDLPVVKRIAIPDKFYSVGGSQDYLRKLAGLELKTEDFASD
jgi:transketolase